MRKDRIFYESRHFVKTGAKISYKAEIFQGGSAGSSQIFVSLPDFAITFFATSLRPVAITPHLYPKKIRLLFGQPRYPQLYKIRLELAGNQATQKGGEGGPLEGVDYGSR